MIIQKMGTIMNVIVLAMLLLTGFTCQRRNTMQQRNYDLNAIKDKQNLIPIAIIGGGPTGLSSAFYGARERYHTVLFQGPRLGGQLVDTNFVENWPSVEKTLGSDIIKRLEKQVIDAGGIIVSDSVATVDTSSWPFQLTTANGTTAYAMAIIVATGGTPRKLGVPGEKEYWGKGIANCTLCDAPFTKGHDVIIVGGGDSSVEFALNLAPFAKSITILVQKNELDASPRMKKRLKDHPTIKIAYNTTIKKMEGDTKRLNTIVVYDTKQNKSYGIPTKWVFLSIGQTPNTSMFGKQLTYNKDGYIVLPGKSQQTNIKGIFAAGRVTEGAYKTGIIGSGEGLKATLNVINEFFQDIGFEEQQEHDLEHLLFKPEITQEKKESEKASTQKSVIEVADEKKARSLIESSSKPVLLEFYSPPCSHCQAMEPIVEAVASAHKDTLIVMRADINQFTPMADSLHIQTVPAFILYKNGKELGRKSGEMSQKDLEMFVGPLDTL